ncbi:hypothetical protein A3Q56_05033 [Intoshia linei]|uniref:SUI1 domain-containing protein n=1 Tax=Intoshia linei TaxID=1819745 RepID=A0A177AYX3_9BILA|nr:hypothetical protein A3Q56_05033 [Intoshia linei]
MSDINTEAHIENSIQNDSKYFVKYSKNQAVSFPVEPVYIPVCDDWPLELISHHPNSVAGYTWAEENNLLEDLESLELNEAKHKKQKRGGKGITKIKKKATIKPEIQIFSCPRGGNKMYTVISGLNTFDIDTKKASKKFSSQFACGSSCVADGDVIIQRNVKADIITFMAKTWSNIKPEDVRDLGVKKR